MSILLLMPASTLDWATAWLGSIPEVPALLLVRVSAIA
jgi:hypothetical protein